MEKWMKKLSGALIASALALTLSTKASAELAEEEETLPPEDPSIEEEGAPGGEGEGILLLSADGPEDGAGGDAEGTVGGEGTMTAFDVGSGTPVGDVPEADPAGGSDGAGGDPTGGDGSGTAGGDTPSIEIINDDDEHTVTVIDPNAQNDIDKTTDDDGTGFWGYDSGNTDSQSDNTVYMVDNSTDSVSAFGTDLYIEAAGINEIDTLYAEQDLYISGTGIMLLDDLYVNGSNITNPFDLPADFYDHFFLQPLDGTSNNGSTNGSVAVFLLFNPNVKDSDGTNGIYVLINGDVPGILDESYVIPEGITLYMPDGTSIELVNPEISSVSTDIEFSDTCGQIFIPSSSLTIPSTSSLVVESGATISLLGENIHSTDHNGNPLNDPLATGGGTVTFAPVLNIEGSLYGAGSITGNGIVELNLASGQDLPSVAIDSGIFKLIRRDGKISGEELDKELYSYLQAHLSAADFAEVTSNDGISAPNGVWGTHGTVFSFMVDDTETSYFYPETPSVNGLGYLGWLKWGIDKLGAGGGNETTINTTGGTGSSIIGGKHAGSIKPGVHSLVLEVTDKETCYNLAAYYDGKQIFSLNNKVTVRFDYPVPTSEGRFFVVFRNGDGSLTAFAARYDAVAGQLVFSGDKLGDFVVVSIDDFDGQLFSAEFYAYLETISSVKSLKASF